MGSVTKILMGRPRDQSWTFLYYATLFTTNRCFVRKLPLSRFFREISFIRSWCRIRISAFGTTTTDIQIANDHLSLQCDKSTLRVVFHYQWNWGCLCQNECSCSCEHSISCKFQIMCNRSIILGANRKEQNIKMLFTLLQFTGKIGRRNDK